MITVTFAVVFWDVAPEPGRVLGVMLCKYKTCGMYRMTFESEADALAYPDSLREELEKRGGELVACQRLLG